MSAMRRRPHLVVQHTDIDLDAVDQDTTWYPMRVYHIAEPDAESNDMFLGNQISHLLECVAAHKNRWWRILYYEEVGINTGEGFTVMNSRANEREATDVVRRDVHVEEFYDRNEDGYYELNRGIPIIEEFPRFHTPADTTDTTTTMTSVELQATAEAAAKDPAGDKPGEEVTGEDPVDETVHVQDGDVIEVYDELGHKKSIQISVV